jgi:hypothetical protein
MATSSLQLTRPAVLNFENERRSAQCSTSATGVGAAGGVKNVKSAILSGKCIHDFPELLWQM